MNKHIKIAIAGAIALALGSVVTGTVAPGLVAVAAADDKPTVSREAGPDLQTAQKAVTAKKWDEALAAIAKVQANPKKNPYDEYIADEFAVSAYVGLKKLPDAEKSLESLLASKYLTDAEKPGRISQAFYINYQLQNYDKALEYGKQAVDRGGADTQLRTYLAQAYYLKGDYKSTQKYVSDLADAQVKAGEEPKEDLLQMGLSAAVKLNDDAGVSRWLEKLVTYHPKPEYWQNLLDSMYRTKSDKVLLQVYRLALDVGALKEAGSYTDMAQLSLDAGSPGEAVAVLQKGFDNNVFTQPADKNRNQHLLDSAKKQSDQDQPSLPKSEADAAKAPTGDAYIGVGTGYFGYKQYDKAATNLAAGIAKGGLKDPIGAQLLLGVAEFKAGKKDDAIKSLGKVKGDPALERVANLWALHARS